MDDKPLEAKAAQGFIAGRGLVHLACEQGAHKSVEALLEGGCEVGVGVRGAIHARLRGVGCDRRPNTCEAARCGMRDGHPTHTNAH